MMRPTPSYVRGLLAASLVLEAGIVVVLFQLRLEGPPGVPLLPSLLAVFVLKAVVACGAWLILMAGMIALTYPFYCLSGARIRRRNWVWPVACMCAGGVVCGAVGYVACRLFVEWLFSQM